MLIAGIDIGTTSVCGVLWEIEIEKPITTLSCPNPGNLRGDNPWEHIQSPEKILGSVRHILQAMSKIGEIQAIGITGQMHGILYTDSMGHAVSPLYTWQDSRGNRIYDDNKSYAQYLSIQTGTEIYSGYGLCTHLYNLKNNLVPKEAYRLCTIGDYIAMNLAGTVVPIMDSTNAASLGGFDLIEGCFLTKPLEEVGIDCDILPEVKSSGTLLGDNAIPVACASGDNQASFLAAVEKPEEEISINVGTGSQVSAYYHGYIPVSGLEVRPFFNRGYLYVGASLNGGSAYAKLAEFFVDCCEEFCGTKPKDIYHRMNRLLEKDEEETLEASPLLYGSRGGISYGSFHNLTSANFTPSQFVKAFVTGIAGELYELYRQFPEAVRLDRLAIAASGTGIRKNSGLIQRVEKLFGLPIRMGAEHEDAAIGAAICAAAGCKIKPNPFI